MCKQDLEKYYKLRFGIGKALYVARIGFMWVHLAVNAFNLFGKPFVVAVSVRDSLHFGSKPFFPFFINQNQYDDYLGPTAKVSL